MKDSCCGNDQVLWEDSQEGLKERAHFLVFSVLKMTRMVPWGMWRASRAAAACNTHVSTRDLQSSASNDPSQGKVQSTPPGHLLLI